MKFTSFISLAHILLVSYALGAVVHNDAFCPGQTTLSEFYIGAAKNVKVDYLHCPQNTVSAFKALAPAARDLESRQSNNVCGATCNTNCFTPSGGGPDPNDCHVIADALRYDSQNTGALFQIGTSSNNTIVMQYSSCLTFFVNQDFTNLVYCRTDWAAVVDWVAPNCQATQNAHGGNCVASDQRWFIQVQHS